MADFNQKNILAFMDWLKAYRGNKVSTSNLRLVHTRKFCRFLMEENALLLPELSAIQKIEGFPKEYADGIKYLSVPEMKLVLAQPDSSKRIGIRDKFFMYLLYDSGCRIQEILDLKISDFVIRNSGAQLHIIGKGNKFRATPISEELISRYEEYCAYFHKNSSSGDYLFYTKRNGMPTKMSRDNAQRFIMKYGIGAKEIMPAIPHLHPHLFRHPNVKPKTKIFINFAPRVTAFPKLCYSGLSGTLSYLFHVRLKNTLLPLYKLLLLRSKHHVHTLMT